MSVTETARSRIGAMQAFIMSCMVRQMLGVKNHGLREFISREMDRFTHDSYSDSRLRAAGQRGSDVVNVMLVIVIASVVGYVGIKATSETEDSIEVTAGTEFDNASNSITSGFSSAMDLTEVVFIVLMLGIIIAVLVGLRARE